MIIDNSKYFDCKVECAMCGKEYNPAEEADTMQKMNIPPLYANIFCCRNCKDEYDALLENNVIKD